METSTMPADPTRGWRTFERALRTAVFVGVFAVVVWALAGGAGLTTTTTPARSGDLLVEVEHASVSRAGLSTPLVITVTAAGGRPLGDVEVGISRSYLDAFDENGLAPQPDRQSSDGTDERWYYDDVEEAILSIDFDARLQPNVHSTRRADLTVTAGEDEARTEIVTQVRP
jgi:hypothetical protein